MTLILLRGYLLVGLVVHKLIWEILKRRRSTERKTSLPVSVILVKAVKLTILAGIAVQTLVPDVLPITSDPVVIRIVGVAIYTAGLLVAISCRLQLGENWSDIETAKVLSHQAVVSNGIYRYIRHPIYVGDLLLLAGLELSLNSWLVAAVALMTPVVLWKAVCEERMLVETLPGYREYCNTTKRFVPFVI